MILKHLVVGPIEENCYIGADEETKEAFVIDPGFEPDRIQKVIEDNGWKVKYIILTHSHYDHIGAVDYIREQNNCKVCVHEEDAEGLVNSEISLARHFHRENKTKPADILLKDGDMLKVGGMELNIIHTPGHTKGGICILCGDILFSGDTLFCGDVGRCDLPGGNYKQLLDSVQGKLMNLKDEIKVFPGHGEDSTIGRERKYNRYTKKEAYELW